MRALLLTAAEHRDQVEAAAAQRPDLTLAPQVTIPPSLASRVRPMLDRARRLYRDLQFEASLAAVGDAQLILEQQAETKTDYHLLHQALALRGMNEAALGREVQASAALQDAARLRPAEQLDARLVPPDVLARYETLRAQVRAEAPASVTLVTEPPGAEVRLDGVPVGHAPTSLHGSPGRHFVHVAAVGFLPRVLALDLVHDRSPVVQVRLPHATTAVLVQQLGGLTATQLSELGRASRQQISHVFKADALVRVEQDQIRGVKGSAVRLASGRFMRAGPSPTLEQLLQALLPLHKRRHTSIWSSPWLWGGVGAALLAGGITALILAQDPAPTVVIVPTQ